MQAILAIYANENGRGMVFNLEEDEGDDDPFPPEDNDKTLGDTSDDKGKGDGKKGSHLTLVK